MIEETVGALGVYLLVPGERRESLERVWWPAVSGSSSASIHTAVLFRSSQHERHADMPAGRVRWLPKLKACTRNSSLALEGKGAPRHSKCTLPPHWPTTATARRAPSMNSASVVRIALGLIGIIRSKPGLSGSARARHRPLASQPTMKTLTRRLNQ